MKISPMTLAAVTLAVAYLGCGKSGRVDTGMATAGVKPIGAPIEIKPPLGLPPVPIPADNPVTVQTVALGRRLFYEKKLSAGNSLACASCHNPLLGFTDRQRHSTGFGGKTGTRNAPTVVNAAYAPVQFWDGRAASLEAQAAGPIANPVEMNQTHDVSVKKLDSDPVYKAQFQQAFGPGPITIVKVEKALASFERTIISGDSPFDRYQYGGDKKALSPAAIRGLAIFTDKARGNCVTCHTIEKTYALFTDGKFHNIGAGVNGEGDLTDPGRYSESKSAMDRGAFKTPTLRNVAKSAPYMHDGSLKTLKDVVDFYAGGGNSNPYLDKEIKEIKLSGRDRADLVEFLESLTGEIPADAGPPRTE
ncbi:MAG TPA: cytochrome c peroxidase [Bryobacteraceae bacterium]|nr:cytochrome c peroxidase [Bryobacteraceae bacterium]